MKFMKLIKKYIIKFNEWLYILQKNIYANRFIRVYINILNTNWIILLGFIQIFLIIGLSYYIDTDLFNEKLQSVLIITFFSFLIKYLYLGILKYFNRKEKFPKDYNEEIQKFFKKHSILNTFLINIFKYINLYRILLLIRNLISQNLRYFRYYIIKIFGKKGYKNWIILEKGLTFIANFLFEYIVMIIDEIYLNFKIKLLNTDWRVILLGRIQIFLIICLTKGLVVFIYIFFFIYC